MFRRLFDGDKISSYYLKYRPTFAASLYDKILEYCRVGNFSYDSAIDVGCGSGQSTFPLTKYFKKVIGTDVSESQLACAPKDNPQVTYHHGPAEDLGFVSSGTVDLVTVSQAFHWFDHPKFYGEVHRILKPSGVLAVYAYGCQVVDNKEAQDQIDDVYNGVLGKYWEKPRRHIDNCYADFELPLADYRRITDLPPISRHMTCEELVGYLSSWSAINAYRKQNPESDEIDKFYDRLAAVYAAMPKTEDKEPTMKVDWPVFLLLGRKM